MIFIIADAVSSMLRNRGRLTLRQMFHSHTTSLKVIDTPRYLSYVGNDVRFSEVRLLLHSRILAKPPLVHGNYWYTKAYTRARTADTSFLFCDFTDSDFFSRLTIGLERCFSSDFLTQIVYLCGKPHDFRGNVVDRSAYVRLEIPIGSFTLEQHYRYRIDEKNPFSRFERFLR